MRVLHVVDGNLPHLETWASVRALRVARVQLDLGFEPRLLAVGPSNSTTMAGSDDPLTEFPVERLSDVVAPRAGDDAAWRERAVFFHRASRRVRRLVKRERLHLVHVYGGPTVALASLLGAQQAEAPVVYEPAFSSASLETAARWALPGFDAVVMPSRDQAEAWSERLGHRAFVNYVPDGIDVERLRDPTPMPDPPTLVVGPLFDAAPNLAWLQGGLSRVPELQRRIRLLVPTPALRDEIRVGWGWPAERVGLFGPSLPALGDALDQATALVYAAPTRRGSAHELLEAAARGRPVIAVRSPGLHELIRDRTSGRLVAEADEADLAAAVETVVERSEAMGRAFRRDAVQSRNWRIIAEGYFEIYDRVRQRGPGARTLNRWIDAALRRLPAPPRGRSG